MSLGKNISKRIDELGWNQKRLGDELRGKKVSQQNISALIKRGSEKSKHARPIAAAMGLTIDELVSGIWKLHSGALPAPSFDGFGKTERIEPKASPFYKPSKTENLIFAIVKSLADEEQEELLDELRAWHETHLLSQRHVRGSLRPVGNRRMLGEFGTPKGPAQKRRASTTKRK